MINHRSLYFCVHVSVWSEDSWLQKHSGATLDSEEQNTEESNTGTKRPAEQTDTVS